LKTEGCEGVDELALTALWQGGHKCSCDLDIAILIGGLHLSSDTAFTIGLVFLGDCAGAGNGIIDACHTLEAHTKFAQRGWPNVVTQHLSYKAHNQHTVSDNAARPDHFT